MVEIAEVAVMGNDGKYYPDINERYAQTISGYAYQADINAAPVTLHTIVAGQKVLPTKIDIVEVGAAGGILEIKEAGTVRWRKYIAASVQTEINIPPITLSTAGAVTLTATAGLTVDVSISGILWTEKTI